MGTFITIVICVWLFYRLFVRKKSTNLKNEAIQSNDWIVRDFKTKSVADNQLVRLKGGSDILVAGFRRNDGKNIAKKLKSNKSSLKLVREPDNKHDTAAIAVQCSLNGRRKWTHIGYLPADLTGNIAAEFTEELPIALEVRRAGWKEDSDAAFLAVNVLVPNAATRKPYLRN